MMMTRIATFAAITGTIFACPVLAQTSDEGLVLGGGIRVAPEYEGSASDKASAIPFLAYSHGRYAVSPDRLSVSILRGNGHNLSFAVGYGGGRDADDLPANGFEDIDNAVFLGARYDVVRTQYHVAIKADHYLGESKGTTLTLEGGPHAKVSDRLTVSATAGVTFSDTSYMDTYFGVTGGEAMRSGLASYSVGSGPRRADVALSAIYTVTDDWFVRGEVGFGKLLGDAADSPLVEDDTPVTTMFLVGYRF